jgi:hypothetical protein
MTSSYVLNPQPNTRSTNETLSNTGDNIEYKYCIVNGDGHVDKWEGSSGTGNRKLASDATTVSDGKFGSGLPSPSVSHCLACWNNVNVRFFVRGDFACESCVDEIFQASGTALVFSNFAPMFVRMHAIISMSAHMSMCLRVFLF